MKISIITPSFNQGKFIEETIKSVLGQKYPNLEYIVIDGASTDNTVDILKKYSKKIKWVSEKDAGQSEAINKGLKIAGGDIIGYLNSDDLLLPGALHAVFKYFKEHPDAYVVTGDYFLIDRDGKKIHGFIPLYKRFLRLFSSFFLLKLTNYINQPSTFWRRKVLEDIGFFDESLPYEMDYDYWIRIGKKYKFQVLSKKLSAFRLHEESKSGGAFIKQFTEEIDVLKKHKIHPMLIFFHLVHNKLIILVYNIIRNF